MAQTQPSPALLYLALAGGILAVSTAAIFIRYAQQEAPSLVIAASRLALASAILAPMAWFRHRSELLTLTRHTLGLGLLSGFFLALHFAAWITSLEFTTVASSVVLVTTTPLWVAILSPIFLRESPARSTWFGLALALLGGSIVGLSQVCAWEGGLSCPPLSDFVRGSALPGNLLALAGAWMGAGYLIIGRRLREKMSLVPYIFVVYSMSAAILLALMLAFRQSPLGYSPALYFWLFMLALVPQLLGHSTFNWALRYLPASFVAITLLGEPIGSTVLAVLLLAETPSALEIGGGLLILAGIYTTSQGKK